MIVVLLIAVAITVAIGDLKDAAVIVAIVILNAAIGFFQEYRAEQAMAMLRNMAAPSAWVVRDGIQATVPARELVPGDLILLDAGDLVPADARLIECPNLRVNEAPSSLGSRFPSIRPPTRCQKTTAPCWQIGYNMVFKGTTVVYGRARAIVVTTGMATSLGRDSRPPQGPPGSRTPLQKRLAVLGRRLAAAALGVCVIVFSVGVLRGQDVALMFLVAVSLAVAAIPEALPAVVTIALALGSEANGPSTCSDPQASGR